MHRFHFAPLFLTLASALALPPTAPAQEKAKQPADHASPGGYGSLSELNDHFAEMDAENRRRQIRDLTKFAAEKSGPEAEAAYRQVFNLAILGDDFETAEMAAEAYLSAHRQPSRTRAVAAFVDLMAAAQKKDVEGALGQLRSFIKAPASERFEPGLLLALGDPFLQGLIRDGRFEEARKLCRLLVDESDSSSVREHFQARLDRIEMLGKPAPAISGSGIDGEAIALGDLKGKVVLVAFWATWCPPCITETPALKDLRSQYKDKGFEILGVNLDEVREGQGEPDKTRARVRRFLVDYGVEWPNILGQRASTDAAKAYGVDVIPAAFLVDREGKIVQVEQGGEDLEKAIARLFQGSETKGRGGDSR